MSPSLRLSAAQRETLLSEVGELEEKTHFSPLCQRICVERICEMNLFTLH